MSRLQIGGGSTSVNFSNTMQSMAKQMQDAALQRQQMNNAFVLGRMNASNASQKIKNDKEANLERLLFDQEESIKEQDQFEKDRKLKERNAELAERELEQKGNQFDVSLEAQIEKREDEQEHDKLITEVKEKGATDRQGKQISSTEKITSQKIDSTEKIAEEGRALEREKIDNDNIYRERKAKLEEDRAAQRVSEFEYQQQKDKLDRDFQIKQADIDVKLRTKKLGLEERSLNERNKQTAVQQKIQRTESILRRAEDRYNTVLQATGSTEEAEKARQKVTNEQGKGLSLPKPERKAEEDTRFTAINKEMTEAEQHGITKEEEQEIIQKWKNMSIKDREKKKAELLDKYNKAKELVQQENGLLPDFTYPLINKMTSLGHYSPELIGNLISRAGFNLALPDQGKIADELDAQGMSIEDQILLEQIDPR